MVCGGGVLTLITHWGQWLVEISWPHTLVLVVSYNGSAYDRDFDKWPLVHMAGDLEAQAAVGVVRTGPRLGQGTLLTDSSWWVTGPAHAKWLCFLILGFKRVAATTVCMCLCEMVMVRCGVLLLSEDAGNTAKASTWPESYLDCQGM